MDNSREIHDDQNLLGSKWTFEESKLLIASVKEQPELYDPRNSKYKLLKVTENLWTNFDLLLKKPMGACECFTGVISGLIMIESLSFRQGALGCSTRYVPKRAFREKG